MPSGSTPRAVSAFPTYFMVSMGSGEPVVLELTTSFGAQLRLDQFAAVDRLVGDAERGGINAEEGLRRLEEIRTSAPRFGRPASVLGYCILTVGLCLILHPTGSDVAAAAVFGVVVGVLRTLASTRANLQILMPVLAAFVVSVLAATAVDHDWIDPALRAVVASLVVFLPGATLTTAVLELAAGQIVSGASRLVAGAVQLGLLCSASSPVSKRSACRHRWSSPSAASGWVTGHRGSACWCSPLA